VSSLLPPRSQITVRHATKFWRIEPGDCASLDADIRVPVASGEFYAMPDAVLEAVLANNPGEPADKSCAFTAGVLYSSLQK